MYVCKGLEISPFIYTKKEDANDHDQNVGNGGNGVQYDKHAHVKARVYNNSEGDSPSSDGEFGVFVFLGMDGAVETEHDLLRQWSMV